MNLLKKLQINTTFLNVSLNLSDIDDDYVDGQKTIHHLKVINDTAERGNKLI